MKEVIESVRSMLSDGLLSADEQHVRFSLVSGEYAKS